MADWGNAILWIYTHIFYFTNRLLEKLAPHEEPLTQCLKSPKNYHNSSHDEKKSKDASLG